MTDEELAKIRQRVIEAKKNDEIGGADFTFEYWNDVSALLAENAAMREIVQAVATEDLLAYEGDAGDDIRCPACGGEEADWRTKPTDIAARQTWRWQQFQHTPDCIVTKARALLGISSQPDR